MTIQMNKDCPNCGAIWPLDIVFACPKCGYNVETREVPKEFSMNGEQQGEEYLFCPKCQSCNFSIVARADGTIIYRCKWCEDGEGDYENPTDLHVEVPSKTNQRDSDDD